MRRADSAGSYLLGGAKIRPARLGGWATREALTAIALLLAPATGRCDPAVYEPATDPGLGFNLISWANFSNGAQVWQNAVQAVYDAGFDEVSLSPVRYYTPGVGSIAATSTQGPELSHIAAGIARAKQLGMRVTVNPFIEPAGFSTWRGNYNPTPGSAESNTFWPQYQQYIADVAAVAQAGGADALNVGTELQALTLNSGNSARWTSVINAASAAFTGSLGYAANWTEYNAATVRNTIWEHPAIDYIGIDSYFENMLSTAQADASGVYRNATFVGQVESAWNNKLDNEILPFAAARKGGAGMPVVFTEVGYLPYNRTAVTPQNSNGAIDDDEQNMVFEGLIRALDGRKTSDRFLAAHLWNWGMPGTGGNLWDMGISGSEPHANNLQTSQWLSDYVKTATDPIDPPPRRTQLLYSFETGLEGFAFPGYAGSTSTLAQATGVGVTDGAKSLAITKTDDDWTWDARVAMSGEPLSLLQEALAGDLSEYLIEIDVTYVASALPAGITDMNLHVSFQPTPGGWTQAFPFADINGAVNQTFRVEVPLSSFTLPTSVTGLALHLGFDGAWPSGSATVYVDRIALTHLADPGVLPGDFNSDGVVDAADYTLWRDNLGAATEAAINGAGDGFNGVDAADYALWRSSYGSALASGSQSVPEAGGLTLAVAALVLGSPRRR